MALTLADVHAAFSATFPAKAELSNLEYVETVPMDDGAFGIVVRLVIWDADGGTVSIRDVKEQQVWLDPRGSSLERFAAFLKAVVHVASIALANTNKILTLMPHDLLISNVLDLAKPQTDFDFVKALSVKSRLGKYLPAVAR